MVGIWIPKQEEPKFKCHLCRTGFLTNGAMIRHVAQCAKQHEVEIQAASRDWWDHPDWADGEFEIWVKEHGRWPWEKPSVGEARLRERKANS